MYFNDIHILYYVVIGTIGLIVGNFINWCNYRLPEYKKVFTLEFFSKEEKRNVSNNYFYILLNSFMYVVILYICGWSNDLLANIKLFEYLILTPMLISAFAIDLKLQIIPNRLNLTMFEIGLLFTFLYSFINISISINRLLGMLVGGGIFLAITIIGGFIAGKEAMGFGDVKLMGALGAFFGISNIIIITLISFLIGAIISIFILIINAIKKNKKISEDGYIPFGPFIVIATFITMTIPSSTLIYALLKIFTLGMYIG